MENVLDASHVPFTHHKSISNRNIVGDYLMRLTAPVDESGFKGVWQTGPRCVDVLGFRVQGWVVAMVEVCCWVSVAMHVRLSQHNTKHDAAVNAYFVVPLQGASSATYLDTSLLCF